MLNCVQVGVLNVPGWSETMSRVYSPAGVSPTVTCAQGGETQIKVMVDSMKIRKLTETEMLRLQGFNDDETAILTDNFSRTACRRFAGNTVTVDVFAAIVQAIYGGR